MNHILKCHDIIKTNFVRGENCYLYDDQGKRYIDFEAGCWAAALGFNHPQINRVMRTQIEKIIHLGSRYPNMTVEDAAMDILDIVGIHNGKCVFLSSGSEAVELSVQIARFITKEQYLLTFTNSCLGSYGSAGTKKADEWQLFDWSSSIHQNECESIKDISFENIGGFVFEPGGSGSESVKFPSKHLVQCISQQITKKGGLLVANEITTGMGRTGKWFGFQHYDIQPDIVALGKCLGNGYPVSAVVMKQEVAEKLENNGFYYVQSHQNDPLGAAVAKEVIAVIREENWIERGDTTGKYFLEGLKRLGEKHNIVKDARGRGMLLALELYPHEKFSTLDLYHMLLDKGCLVGYRPGRNFLRFDPSLTIYKENVDYLLECLNDILRSIN